MVLRPTAYGITTHFIFHWDIILPIKMDLTNQSCFIESPQYFLVCVTIHKAKNLSIFNADTYVRIIIDKKCKKTAVFQNSNCPFFNEYFVFELYCDLYELIRLTVQFSVFKETRCGKKDENIGDILIDLNTVWNQPNHIFFKKWGQLENPIDCDNVTNNENRGYLQIDLSIVSKYDQPSSPVISHTQDYDVIENNLLQPYININNELEITAEKVKYIISIYRGEFIHKNDYTIQIQFAGIMAKTKQIIKNTKRPEWNEQIMFHWFYPSLCQTFIIQIMINECLGKKVLCEMEIHFDDMINYETNKYPTLGPTYLHFYQNKNIYLGRLLFVINTELCEGILQRKPIINKIPLLTELDYWSIEKFIINIIIFNVSSIDLSNTINTNKIKFQFHCGEFSSNELEFILNSYNKLSKRKYSLKQSTLKYMSLNLPMPDCRLKYQIDRFLDNIVQKMENTIIELVESKKMLKHNKFNVTINEIGTILQKIISIIKSIENILENRLQDKCADLFINGIVGNNVVAVFKTNPKLYYYSSNKQSMGRLCGQRHSILLKKITCNHSCRNCGCIFGMADIAIWIGTEQENYEWIPTGWKETQTDCNQLENVIESQFKCNVYIHQAKIRPGNDLNGLVDGKITVTINNHQYSTLTINDNLAPIWNEMITFNSVKLMGSIVSYKNNPPYIIIELYDVDGKKKLENFIGIAILKPSIKLLDLTNHDKHNKMKTIFETDLNTNNEIDDAFNIGSAKKSHRKIEQTLENVQNIFPPPLKWITVSRDGVLYAEILASAELIQLKEPISDLDEIQSMEGIPKEICPIMKKFKIEIIFAGLRNMKNLPGNTLGRFKMELCFGELNLKSGPSSKKYGDSVNFLDPFKAGYVKLPEQHQYWPSIIIKHVDISAKKEITIGAIMLSKSNKYFKINSIDNTFFDCKESESKKHLDTEINIEELENVPLLDSTTQNYESNIDPTFIEDEEQENEEDEEEDGDDDVTNFNKNENTLFKRSKILFMNSISSNKKKQINNNSKLSLQRKRKRQELEYTWWTKFYNSIDIDNKLSTIRDEINSRNKHYLKIFPNELEKQIEYNNLQDWAEPMPLIKGIMRKKNSIPIEEMYGQLKCSISIEDHIEFDKGKLIKNYPSFKFETITNLITETKICVRLYIVQGINLRSKDIYGSSDSYIKVEYGKNKIVDRAHYIPNQTNPIYGKRFQLNGIIPKDLNLRISVYDFDECCCFDDLIGSTMIDLEDRLRTKHRALCGISNEYNRSGYNIWRNIYKPSEILQQICEIHNLNSPIYVGNKIQIDGITFYDTTQLAKDEDIKERLSLSVLKELDKIPKIGYKLIPEHVETRSLYRDDRPGIEQGKLQMWIEIYDPDNVSPFIDLTPSPARLYELRIVIWNTKDVILDEQNIFGKRMSDIYIKGWLDDIEQAQYTDIHYRSLTGDGNFNWRMIFPFKYSKIEDMMVVIKKKEIYEKYNTELKMPITLNIQVWDNDSLSADDFLGSIELNLSNFQEPVKNTGKCILKNKTTEYINLFLIDNVRGWFPIQGRLKNGKIGQTGKIEMELKILNNEDALIKPAGKGRAGPESLPLPNRPETSFNWFTNPMKSMKYIVGKRIKKLLLYFALILLILFVILILLYNLSGELFHSIKRIFI